MFQWCIAYFLLGVFFGVMAGEVWDTIYPPYCDGMHVLIGEWKWVSSEIERISRLYLPTIKPVTSASVP